MPLVATDNHAGPLAFENLYGGVPPVAVAAPEIAVPTVPDTGGAVTERGAGATVTESGGTVTVTVSVAVAVTEAESVTVTPYAKLPLLVDVPEIAPSVAMDSQGGPLALENR